MRRKIIVILSVVVVMVISVTTVVAGNPSFDGPVSFTYGSLDASGTLVGLGNQDVTVVLNASGIPVVSCNNLGGNQAPGQNPPKVSGSGTEALNHNTFTRNGKSPFGVVANANTLILTAVQLGCPNNNWTANVLGINWTNAEILVWPSNAVGVGSPLIDQRYTCVTTSFVKGSVVNCTPIP